MSRSVNAKGIKVNRSFSQKPQNFTFDREDEERIKFVSMIDQRPIKPSYLELIPLQDFTKKEHEAQRNQ